MGSVDLLVDADTGAGEGVETGGEGEHLGGGGGVGIGGCGGRGSDRWRECDSTKRQRSCLPLRIHCWHMGRARSHLRLSSLHSVQLLMGR